MLLQKIKSDGIAHLSYILGDGMEAAVIDPRRDCRVYADIAAQNGMKITRIFETHRNEDYVIGSQDLSKMTGASIYHGKALDFAYGEGVSEGDSFKVGDLHLSILETPGHTFESISIVVRDANFGDDPVAVFAGDVLFIGDVGRTDFFPDRAQEVAGLLYDSIFSKLLPLGDQTILYPAHGAGSVCGGGLAAREFSTLGYERRNNPALQKKSRKEFIEYKISEYHYQPPYFRKMEQYNKDGAPPLGKLPQPVPMTAAEVLAARENSVQLVDLRSPEAFAGAFIPGSIAIPVEMVPAYAGYFLDYQKDIILIPESVEQVETAVIHFIRLGFDCVIGYLKGGLHSWEVGGYFYDRIGAVHAADIDSRLKQGDDFTLLDVRQIDEYKAGRLTGATHIFLGELLDRMDEIEKEKPVVTFCGSGKRAIIAASLLKLHGFDKVEDSLGSMQACKNAGCEIINDQ